MVIDELVTVLGLEIASSALPDITKFNDKLAGVIRYAEGVAAAALLTGAAIFAFVETMSSSAADIDKFSQYTGMSTDSIQKWGYAVEQAGGHASAIKADLTSLEKSLNPVRPGAYNEGLFMMFGEGAKNIKTADEALMAVSQRMQGMTAQRQMQWGELIGLSPETMLLIQQGPKAIKGYFDEIKNNLISPEQARRAREFQKEWKKLETTFYKTGENIVTSLLPGVQKVLKEFDHWVTTNREFIQGGLDKFIKGVSDGFSMFGNTLSGLREHMPAMKGIFEFLLDPRIIGGTVFAALTGIAGVLGLIAAKYVLIGGAILIAVAAAEDVGGKLTEKGSDNKMRSPMFAWLHDKMQAFADSGTGTTHPDSVSTTKDKSMMSAIRSFLDPENGVSPLRQMLNPSAPVGTNGLPNLRDYAPPPGAQTTVNNNVTNNVTVTTPDAFIAGPSVIDSLRKATAGSLTGRGVSGAGQ
jgi:hypothetical protein